MKLFGLTGGIASGKSTVTRLLRERGVEVLDADVIAREVVQPGTPALAAIAQRFPGVVGSDGALDRKALGQRVFADAAERQALNAIVHPQVRGRVAELTRALASRGVPFAVYDAALLIENRLHEELDGVVLVTAPVDVQRQRLMARDGLDERAAQARIDAQLPLADKQRYASWLVDNGASLEATVAQVDSLVASLRAASGVGS